MAREFGQGIDAGGVPIELGAQFEIANIHYRMGAHRLPVRSWQLGV